MKPPSPLPGAHWFHWLRNKPLRIGVLTGVYLSIVFAAWLIVANRVPWSERVAGLRNGLALAVLVLLALIPVVRFLRTPASLFLSGVTGWAVLTLVYGLFGLYFERLFARMGPFRLFVLGAVGYGVSAVVAWVASLLLAARHHPVAIPRRRSY